MSNRRPLLLTLLVLGGLVAAWAQTRTPELPKVSSGARPAGVPAVTPSVGPSPWFTDVTQESGLVFRTFLGVRSNWIIEDMGPGLAVGDVDGDGDLDVYAVVVNAMQSFRGPTNERASNALFLNDGHGRFVRSSDSGAEFQGVGMGAVLVDLDSDGVLDLFVTNFGPDRLFKGLGAGRFKDVTTGSGLGDPGFSAGPGFGDFDGDGDLDLYLPRYVAFDPRLGPAPPSAAADVMTHGRDPKALAVLAEEDKVYVTPPPYGVLPVNFRPLGNRVLRNDGGMKFTDITEDSGAEDRTGRSMQAVVADLNGDGRQDVFVANDVSLNRLFLGRGDGTFEDASERLELADPRGAMGVAVADLGGGAGLDLFVTNFSTDTNGLWVDKDAGGTWSFRPAEAWLGLSETSLGDVGFGVVAADFDLDGRTDLFVANGHIRGLKTAPGRLGPQADRLYLRGDERFDLASGALPGPPRASRGAVAADLDGDGDEDLLVADREGLRYLRNDQRSGHGWLKVRGAPVGAVVTVSAGGRSLGRKPVLAGGSYLCGPPAELIFGLGAQTRVEVEVRWPDGRIVRRSVDRINQTLQVKP